MKQFKYLSVKLDVFVNEATLYMTMLDGAYLSADVTSQLVAHLQSEGYRLHSIVESMEVAIFEREVAMEKHDTELVSALRAMLEAWKDQFGQDACDCRTEPENAGHICQCCRAKLALNQYEQHIKTNH